MQIRNTVLALALATLFCGLAQAHEYKVGKILIVHPWSNPTQPGTTTGTAYMHVKNTGRKPVRLLSATTPAADRVEFHTMTMTDNIMRMRPATNGILIAAKGELKFGPGATHMMLIGLKKPLEERDFQGTRHERRPVTPPSRPSRTRPGP